MMPKLPPSDHCVSVLHHQTKRLRTVNPEMSIFSLPPDVIRYIGSFISYNDMVSLQSASRKFHTMFSAEEKSQLADAFLLSGLCPVEVDQKIVLAIAKQEGFLYHVVHGERIWSFSSLLAACACLVMEAHQVDNLPSSWLASLGGHLRDVTDYTLQEVLRQFNLFEAFHFEDRRSPLLFAFRSKPPLVLLQGRKVAPVRPWKNESERSVAHHIARVFRLHSNQYPNNRGHCTICRPDATPFCAQCSWAHAHLFSPSDCTSPHYTPISPEYIPRTPGGYSPPPPDFTSLFPDDDWHLPGIEVRITNSSYSGVCNAELVESGEDSCVVKMLDSGDKVTIPKKAVAPVQHLARKDKVKVIQGLHKGFTAVVLGIDGTHLIVRLAPSQDIAVLRNYDVARMASG